MNYWWVNHKQTFKQETGGNYIWSPTTNRGGARNRFYENMPRIRKGDIVVSYSTGAIRALGVAAGTAAMMPRPEEFGKAGEAWTDQGWRVPVRFSLLSSPIRPSEHMDILGPTLPPKYSPIQTDGSGNQGAYLSEVNPAMAGALKGLLGAQWNHSEAQAPAFPEADLENEDEGVANQILQRTDIGATERQQLVKARRGQGVYRKNLEALESGCRVTGLTERRHLRASHIKPWRLCTDFEKLDGNNGLLLSPHLDHLFDQGFISFENEGAMLIIKGLPESVLSAWHLPTKLNIGPLRIAQQGYLEFHRKFVFSAQNKSISE